MTPLLSARLAEDYPLAQLVSVRCRSTSCTIEYDLPAARAKEIWVYLQLTMPQGTRVAPSLGIDDDGDGVTRATFDGVFDDDMGGGADFREWFAWASEITDQQRDEIRDWQRRGIEWWE